ncbi:MAG TPA: type VI secretion system baseplate subunit TssG [Candidatus Acidoferrales bacterium]|nr:type VI secretion system baseplate subunit TssG [Candidatus Acidoferrales bacterium]
MASEGGAVNPAVAGSEIEARLREEPFTFEFFQAMRLLERLLPDRAPVGGFGHPSAEVVRLGAHPSLAFPASEIQSLQWEDGKAPSLSVNFMGMTGVQGALPQWYTALVLEQLRSGDSTLRSFLDIFNHRSLSLFYRAWQKYRFAVTYERGDRDRFFLNLLALIGLATPGLSARQAVEDEALIFYAGLLAPHQRSAAALEQLLSDYFDVPAEVDQLVGGWYRLDPNTQCCMDGTETPSQELGKGAVLGDETFDQHSRIRIRLGPLSLAQYLEFLPSGSAFKPLQALTRFYSNEEFEFEIQLILQHDEVPRCELGAEEDAAPRLGWVTWVKSEGMERDPADTVLAL